MIKKIMKRDHNFKNDWGCLREININKSNLKGLMVIRQRELLNLREMG